MDLVNSRQNEDGRKRQVEAEDGDSGQGFNEGRLFGKMILLALAVLLGGQVKSVVAQTTEDAREQRIRQLEMTVKTLNKEVQSLKAAKDPEGKSGQDGQLQKHLKEMRRDIDKIESSKALDLGSWLNKFTLGGYGEMHANFGEGKEKDLFDLHRLVLYLGYDFSDWIKFHSETELEHAFVSDDGGGEVSMEQAYVDFLLSEAVNIRVGRILTPIGIINKTHEPPFFNGVERPSFAKFIIPTTWSSDGIGVFGSATESIQYEAYVVGGLDGSEFNAKNGIRDGRIKERPSLHEPAFTGRLDFYPFTKYQTAYNQDLRLGISTYLGGLDNGNKGDNPDINGDIQIYSADFEYTISRFDFRCAVADIRIDEAREIGNGIAKEIFGFYAEAGYHFLPDNWKKGKLVKADAVVFVRYDDFDTQHKMPSGIPGNRAYDRNEWTMGLSFYPIPEFVIKADYQIRDDDSGDSVADLLNFGVGWVF